MKTRKLLWLSPCVTGLRLQIPALAAGLALALAGVGRAQTAANLEDIGPFAPSPGPDDIYQTISEANLPPGLNYYCNNPYPPGQTFTTLNHPNGYVLTSLAVATGGGGGGGIHCGQDYWLGIYSVSNNTASLAASFFSQTNFTFTELHWLRWTNLRVPLKPNQTYAYAFARIFRGWERMGSAAADLYAGGAVCLIPPHGGAVKFSPSSGYDAAFVAGLSVATSLSAHTIAPAEAVSAGEPAQVTVLAAGPTPIYYQWQTDGGTGGALTNIPGAISASLPVSTTNLAGQVIHYAVVISNSASVVTSAVSSLAVAFPVCQATLTDRGPAISRGACDIAQLIEGGNGDGLNYHDDTGWQVGGPGSGQTFTTGNDEPGYFLTSVAIKTGGGRYRYGGAPLSYDLFIFSVDGMSATVLAHYTNASFQCVYGDWLQWSGLSLPLKPGSTYAYTFGLGFKPYDAWQTGLASSPSITDVYAGGQICAIPDAGGPIVFGNTGLSDAVFDLGLVPIGNVLAPVASGIVASPSTVLAAGTTVTLSEAALGSATLHYQWRTDGGSGGMLTNIPSATTSNLVLNTTGWQPGPRRYDVIVTNTYGASTGAVLTVALTSGEGTAVLSDIGPYIPRPIANDIYQLDFTNSANSTDTLNYYSDNGYPPGQTFMTGNHSTGYLLTSLAIKMAGNASLPSGGQPYVLRVYTVSGGSATLYATYISQSDFAFYSMDWLSWHGLALPLAPNTMYAYTLSGAGGWCKLASAERDPYVQGELCLIPPNGGPIILGPTHACDGAFVIGLTLPGYPIVSPPAFEPANYVHAGTRVTLTSSVNGSGPYTYQWQTDDGTGGALTNIPGATGPTLTIDTTGMDGLSVNYALVVSNSVGATFGEAATLAVFWKSGPYTDFDTTPMYASSFVGGTVTFSAGFAGTLPIAYQWQVDKGSGPSDIVGQTNATLVLNDLRPSDAGYYNLRAYNAIDTNFSSYAYLGVFEPTAPFTVNFQWYSLEGGNDVGLYGGPGIPGFGSGVWWNPVYGPSFWNPGTFRSSSGMTDEGFIETGCSWTLVTGGSWDWSRMPIIPLLDSAASAYSTQSFTFTLPNGIYNLVLFSCNGTEASTANAGTLFTINGSSQIALPTQNTSFVQGDNFVVFTNLVVTDYTLTGTWEPTAGKSYGSLNGAQLQYVSPVAFLDLLRLVDGRLQLQWPQGALLQSTNLAGPWVPNSATSPFTLSPTNQQQFYRLKIWD